MTTFTSDYRATIRRGVHVVVEARNGREIGCYGFATHADAADYERRMRGQNQRAADEAAKPREGEVVLYRSKAGAERPCRVLRAYTQRRRVRQGPNGMGHWADCEMVELEAPWAERGSFAVGANLVRRA